MPRLHPKKLNQPSNIAINVNPTHVIEMSCPLCRLAQGEVITKLYYVDKMVIVVDCKAHHRP